MHTNYKNLFKKTSAKFLSAAITLDTLLNSQSAAYAQRISNTELSDSLLLQTSVYLGTGITFLTLSYYLGKNSSKAQIGFGLFGVGFALAGLVTGLAYLYR